MNDSISLVAFLNVFLIFDVAALIFLQSLNFDFVIDRYICGLMAISGIRCAPYSPYLHRNLEVYAILNGRHSIYLFIYFACNLQNIFVDRGRDFEILLIMHRI